MAEPLISVLLPCFNAERWVRRAVHSLLIQTYRRIEVIAVNDGSTDATGAILEEMALHDHRLKVTHHTSNIGIVSGLNNAIAESSGDYIARMDADDVSHPQRFEHQLFFLKNESIDICGTWVTEVGGSIPRTVRFPISASSIRATLLFFNCICHPTWLARREVFERYQYRQEFIWAEDYDLVARATTNLRPGNLAKPMLRYLKHSGQVSSARREQMRSATDRIRSRLLRERGLNFDEKDEQAHNKLRAPYSIQTDIDLENIESWLIKLADQMEDPESRIIVASQWIRACIRAAPLGKKMWRSFKSSPLLGIAPVTAATKLDLYALSRIKLDYNSSGFQALKRIGLSS